MLWIFIISFIMIKTWNKISKEDLKSRMMSRFLNLICLASFGITFIMVFILLANSIDIHKVILKCANENNEIEKEISECLEGKDSHEITMLLIEDDKINSLISEYSKNTEAINGAIDSMEYRPQMKKIILFWE